ncbi:MAG: phosphopantothenate--cysteine ligase [Firmicutes bacterium]|nr:phosphopantothenate--cysteine ligase [Bacillota bacterium]
MKKIIITAGGTSEPIDEIRAITNKSTGSLGSKIAAEFARRDEVEKIFYIHGKGAIVPDDPKIELIPIRSTDDLLQKITELTEENVIDIMIHSMAVSDYTTASFISLEEFLKLLAEGGCETLDDVRALLEKEDFRKRYTKLPSSIDDPLLMLKQTPKVISKLRDMAPDAVIVGFKLLDHVSHEELMKVAAEQILKNRTDFCLANDYATVVSPVHVGFLLSKEGKEQRYEGKDAIARGVVENTIGF